jgi:hypothetical protein
MSGVACVLALALVVGCGGSTTHKDSGFLEDYSQLEPMGDKAGKARLYASPTLSIDSYDKILIEPMAFFLHPDAKGTNVDSGKVSEVTTYFDTLARDTLLHYYQVVDQPGPGVMRLKTALTDINTASPTKNVVSTIVIKTGVDVGGASIEAELLDSQTGELIASFVDSRKGRSFLNTKNYRSLGDSKKAIQYWVEHTAEYLDAIRARHHQKSNK